MNSKIRLNYHFNKKAIIQKKILDWYDAHGRQDLPWKSTNIYKIWISEIMLQQTQVKTVIPYYKSFINKYPTLDDLLLAQLDDILKIWSGLGFYRRAENIFNSCNLIKKQFNRRLPVNYNELISLPGIGRTTASAILTFSGNGCYSILDGNVKRFLSRLYKVDNISTNVKLLWDLSEQLLSKKRPKDFIQAYMDLGSIICKSSNPLCFDCPANKYCLSFLNGVSKNTVKPRNTIKKKSIWVLALVNNNKEFFLERSSYNQLWRGLYTSPIFKSKNELVEWINLNKIHIDNENNPWKFTHSLSHIKFNFNVIFIIYLC